jgi:Flagellar FliJ protein
VPAALERLLRVRSLLEDAARTALEREVQAAAQIDRALGRETEAAARLHAQGLVELLSLASETQVAGKAYPLADDGVGSAMAAGTATGLESAAAREKRVLSQEEFAAGEPARSLLQRVAAQAERRTATIREELLALRKERRQIEILLEGRARQQHTDEARREQRHLDDWFALRLRMRRLSGQ